MRPSQWFFGYGSLVNRATHNYPDSEPALLKSWRRCWVDTNARDFGYLSAYPCDNGEIEGLIAKVPGGDWQALDERERAYKRCDVSLLVSASISRSNIEVYSVPKDTFEFGLKPKPILLSYLDVVLRGYRDVFGYAGAERFAETTDGWERQVLNDRAQPIYSRHIELSQKDRNWIDEMIKNLPLKVLSPDCF